MDDRREEHVDLLPPSGSNNDPFPAVAPWSIAGHSSSSATLVEPLPTAQLIRLGGTPGVIAGLLFGAALTAVLHHIYLFILRGHTVSGQFWIKNSSNVLSTLVQWLCRGSISIWWLLRRRPFTIRQLNHFFGLHDPLRILRLASSKRLWSVIPVIAIAIILQAFELVSILAPNSLEIGTAPPTYTNLTVPTVSFSKTNLSGSQCDDDKPYAAWQKVLGRALLSDKLLAWDAPVGCGTACNYTILYAAPALRCTTLGMDAVDRLVPSTIPYAVVYNATHTGTNMTLAWRMYGDNGQSTATGAHCSLYNTTQKSDVSFVNNNATISPSIISYDYAKYYSASVSNFTGCITLEDGDVSFEDSHNYAYIVTWLYEQLNGTLLRIPRNDSVPAFTWIPGTNFNLISNNLFSLNETAGTFNPNSDDVISALEQILVNATVALIASLRHNTRVDASVAQDQLVWVYDVGRLWIIYSTALAVTAACGAVGLACILKNGEDSDLTFWDIVRATRNSELDVVVEGEKSGDM
ncbi:hypothetical protein EDD18DRAFT_1326541 [Armillaria luteobubalina]|uniref:Transmembrane protein n=1 Tax=Armillaria luteobubalina TaxID=153913 RepID=A0AA39U0X1_9AGAR|nr:hypothetical protein EDD18DRAFT_1326541 [Armillaria luteobubalina]